MAVESLWVASSHAAAVLLTSLHVKKSKDIVIGQHRKLMAVANDSAVCYTMPPDTLLLLQCLPGMYGQHRWSLQLSYA